MSGLEPIFEQYLCTPDGKPDPLRLALLAEAVSHGVLVCGPTLTELVMQRVRVCVCVWIFMCRVYCVYVCIF